MFKRHLNLCVTLLSLLVFAPLAISAQDEPEQTAVKKTAKKAKKAISPIIPALKKIGRAHV